ncbi:cation:proton antiporter [Paraburkholderia domus]|uniref:K(+)/H(+) antiporter NhaP2 n=1 Tax=Paraburkholderia domus TaxID=2793075 RepID=A0A9N8N3E9_9BURK|nr:cation:proton antiporter [Paraburkholderia domus]MBK5064383.1 cation:proton antiporter [Burkholderia sp. R-70199]MBK5168355.1 cation:proton antiporter [Burkholderia sp. R-70211]CAE6937717.1 K(+)/H(+) antiporter NhaP2 [Paraburkholderia domus]CAE6947639.1 K(+)/H(+) antiporter NhaP2 [Paraburkholderia domus]CAE6949580.1 K(+)/H(+) antiporter NhaP2 [Paraburkholderia domus]
MVLIAAFIAIVFLYSLVSRWLEKTILTAPILFSAAGALMAISPEALNELALDRKSLLLVAELGLVMTLFTDASRVTPRMLKGHTNLPVRLLSAGMLLTIALGALCAMIVFRTLTWWEAGILAAILAPTDAGLGQMIVNSKLVPQRIRQALNVEAGLNDGLAVPFMMFFIALALAQEGGGGGSVLTRFLGQQIGYGTLVGLGVGLTGGWLLGLARRKEWMAEPLAQLGVVALPLACVLASEAIGASMFIAAFVAGLSAHVGFSEVGKHSVEFTEEWGQLFNYVVFFLFGLLVTRFWDGFTFAIVAYGVLSLTLIRMAPVAIALRGTGLSRSTVLFMGWFGPRGLASIVLGLVYLEGETNLPGESTIKLAVAATVLLSIFAHGLTALPGIGRYATAIAKLNNGAPEHEPPGSGRKNAEAR